MDPAKEYAEFLDTVKRTIYLDNISPKATKSILKAAFDKFGKVTRVQFIPAFMQPNGFPHAALIEMENSKQAEQIISEMESCPFMIGGMPRPVRGKISEIEMFDDRPRKPGRRILCRWLNPKEPKFQVAMKIKNLVKKHAAEASSLNERKKTLQKYRLIALSIHSKKLELTDGVFTDGTVKRLARRYRIDTKDV